MYRFVRYQQNVDGGSPIKSDWMFVPQSISDIEDFHQNYTLPICNKEVEAIIESVKKYGDNPFCKKSEKKFFNGDHPTTVFQSGLCSLLLISKDQSNVLVKANNMVIDVYANRIKSFNDGHVYMYSSDGLISVPFIKSMHTIIEEQYKDIIEFPKINRPSYSDIRIIQWPGGRHFYAKIGNEDVVVNGMQKWNSSYEARLAAKSYIDSL